MSREIDEKILLLKRLFVAREEQRATDGQKYGEHMYGPVNMEDCLVDLNKADELLKEGE